MDPWIEVGPWTDLEGLPQKCARASGEPLTVVGPELAARLKDGSIPSRIRPDCVKGVDTYRAPGVGPRPHVGGTTTNPTVQGNGGWDRVDWVRGEIDFCPVQVHLPSVNALIDDLRSNQPTPPQPKVATDEQIVEAIRRVYASTAANDPAPNKKMTWEMVRDALKGDGLTATKDRVQAAADAPEFANRRGKPGEHRTRR